MGLSGKDLDGYDKANVPEEDEIDGWRGVTLTKDNAMAVVYSDIEDTAGGRFDARYDASLDDERMKRYRLDTTNGRSRWIDHAERCQTGHGTGNRNRHS